MNKTEICSSIKLAVVVVAISILAYKVRELENFNCHPVTYYHAREIGSEMFREYAAKKFETLRNGLDQKSNEVLDFALNSMIYQAYLIGNDNVVFENKYPDYYPKYFKQWKSEEKQLKDKYRICDNDFFRAEIFFFHHGLRFADNRILGYIKNKNIVDCGAFIGDSLLVLKDYTDKTVYCYDFSPKNIEEFQNTVKNNNVTNYKLITAALGDKVSQMRVSLLNEVSGSQGLGAGNDKTINVTTIDAEAAKEKFTVGFIKMDLEGCAFKAIKGAIETIKRDRPVLSLAVYHNTDELFGIKPYLEANLENYIYEFKLQQFADQDFVEMILFAYPKEIMEK